MGASTSSDATLTDTDSSGNAAVAPALTGELDGEITQLLRSLSKRDATTKSKALQASRAALSSACNPGSSISFMSALSGILTSYHMLMQKLKTVIASKDAPTVAACLPAWAYVFNKLVMDNNRLKSCYYLLSALPYLSKPCPMLMILTAADFNLLYCSMESAGAE